jgi:hypothetical protein
VAQPVTDYLPYEQLRNLEISPTFGACWSSTNGHATPPAARRFSNVLPEDKIIAR